jgi:alcohol dehydrogenase
VIEVGGPATITESLQAVAFEGEIASIGFLSQENPGIDFFALKRSGAFIRSISVGDRSTLEDLVRSLTTRPIKPVIEHVFEFADSKAAFDHLLEGSHVGKIVIRVS